MDETLLTTAEVAKFLNVGIRTIRSAVTDRRIPHIRLWQGPRRSLLRFRLADIEQLIKERTERAKSKSLEA